LVFSLVVVMTLVGLTMARTTLDRGAFELADLEARIAQAENRNEELLVEVARLESPSRIGPLAEEMGLVYPETARPLLVEGVGPTPNPEDPRWAELRNLAVSETTP
jgi:cell division protein FtsL